MLNDSAFQATFKELATRTMNDCVLPKQQRSRDGPTASGYRSTVSLVESAGSVAGLLAIKRFQFRNLIDNQVTVLF